MSNNLINFKQLLPISLIMMMLTLSTQTFAATEKSKFETIQTHSTVYKNDIQNIESLMLAKGQYVSQRDRMRETTCAS